MRCSGRRGEPASRARQQGRLNDAALRESFVERVFANVLQHLAGHLKRSIDAGDRHALAAMIEEYHTGAIPLVVPNPLPAPSLPVRSGSVR